MYVTLSHCCREKRQGSSPEMGPSNSPGLNPVDCSLWVILQDRVCRSRIHDVKQLEERLLREWRVIDHSIIAAAIAQSRSCLSACIVYILNINFELNDFLVCSVRLSILVSVNLINIHYRQSANSAWNVLLLCLRILHLMLATKRMCGKKFLHRVLWHSFAKLCSKIYTKSVYICKSYSEKKSMAPFCVDMV